MIIKKLSYLILILILISCNKSEINNPMPFGLIDNHLVFKNYQDSYVYIFSNNRFKRLFTSPSGYYPLAMKNDFQAFVSSTDLKNVLIKTKDSEIEVKLDFEPTWAVFLNDNKHLIYSVDEFRKLRLVNISDKTEDDLEFVHYENFWSLDCGLISYLSSLESDNKKLQVFKTNDFKNLKQELIFEGDYEMVGSLSLDCNYIIVHQRDVSSSVYKTTGYVIDLKTKEILKMIEIPSGYFTFFDKNKIVLYKAGYQDIKIMDYK